MTSQSSGGSGSGLPGITGDGLTPGGIHVAGEETVVGPITGASLTTGDITGTGALTAGDSTAAVVPTFHTVYGNAVFHDTVANNVDDDDIIDIEQQVGLTADSGANALRVVRTSALNGHNFTAPALLVSDSTGGTAPVATFFGNSASQFQVDADGVQVHGKLKTGASVTHTASVLSGKCVPIYDEAGTLLGYMPLYN